MNIIEMIELVDAIQSGDCAFGVAIFGGGARAISEFYRRSNGADHLPLAYILGTPEAVCDFLDYVPMDIVSATTAKIMAKRCHEELIRVQKPDDPEFHVGLGCVSRMTGLDPECFVSIYCRGPNGQFEFNPVEKQTLTGKRWEGKEQEVTELILGRMVRAMNMM